MAASSSEASEAPGQRWTSPLLYFISSASGENSNKTQRTPPGFEFPARVIKCFHLTSVVLFHRILTAWLINTTFFSLFIYLFFSESRGVTSREFSLQFPPPPSDAAYLHQDVEGAGAGAVGAGEEIVEVDAVGVVLLHDRQLEAGLLADVVLGDVHVHVGTYGRGREVRKTPGRHSWLNVHLLKFTPFWKTSNQTVSGAARLVSSINRAVGFASVV